MKNHPFVFSAGHWVGEGKITLNMVMEELMFNTNWGVQGRDFAGKIVCTQDIQIHGLSENMKNELTFFDVGHDTFSVDMQNHNVGRIVGTGVYDENRLGWEFRNNDMDFEGFETYTLQPDGSYHMHGEYVTTDQFRTKIEAKIWQKAKTLGVESKESGPFLT